ncbi:Hypothetical predicted protein, partial [Pelobates cultripes]
MSDTQMEPPVTHWEAKFLAAFDKICSAFWHRVESLPQLHAPLETHALTASDLAAWLTPEAETSLAQSPYLSAPLAAQTSYTVVQTAHPSSGLVAHLPHRRSHTQGQTFRCNKHCGKAPVQRGRLSAAKAIRHNWTHEDTSLHKTAVHSGESLKSVPLAM